jgi:hypothetical protein
VDWTRQEVEIAVADYFAMLESELRGQPINKARRNAALRQLLPGRSAGSIEFKHQNISAVMVNYDLPYIAGYKPRQNYQALVEAVVLERFETDAELPESLAGGETLRPEAAGATDFDNLMSLEEPAPEPRSPRERTPTVTALRKVDFVARDAANRKLGRLGEEWTLEYECRRLVDLERRPDLSRRVRHVSALDGDGAGYDIASFDGDGTPRLIEVKTTGLGKSFPFFVSANELAVSKARPDEFQLYRVFDFSREPRLFRLPGPLDHSCDLQPALLRAEVRMGADG